VLEFVFLLGLILQQTLTQIYTFIADGYLVTHNQLANGIFVFAAKTTMG
jgi:hypothetical protein